MDPAVIRQIKCKSCAKPSAPVQPPPKPAAPPSEKAAAPPAQPAAQPKPPMEVVPAQPKQVRFVLPHEEAPFVEVHGGGGVHHHGWPFHPRAAAAHYPPPVHMRGHWQDIDHLSRIPRLDNIEMTLSRGYRMNFRENYPLSEQYYDTHCYEYPPPQALPPPPVMECNRRRHHHHHHHQVRRHHYHQAPPPMDYDCYPHYGGLSMDYDYHSHPASHYHVGYPYNYFSDENPNGCSVM